MLNWLILCSCVIKYSEATHFDCIFADNRHYLDSLAKLSICYTLAAERIGSILPSEYEFPPFQYSVHISYIFSGKNVFFFFFNLARLAQDDPAK